jgi:uncharacterized protein YbbK (DUF523 family)
MEQSKIPIGISSCLMGDRVRLDSGHKNNTYITKTLSEYFEFQPFCPEKVLAWVFSEKQSGWPAM